MKLWKHTLITAFAFLGISTAVLYTSCEKDSCLDLKCKNGGACVEGFCRCPTGYEGTECETQAATKFLGRFYGHFTCGAAPLTDTVDIWLLQAPNQVKFVEHFAISDTLTGTVNGNDLSFTEKVDGNIHKFTMATVDGNKITVFSQQTNETTSGACNFIGFK